MNLEKLKERIKNKFTTMTAFANLAGIDRYELQKAFTPFYSKKPEYKEFLKEVALKVRELNPGDDPRVIPAEKIELLREAINAAGGAPKVCKESPKELPASMVYGILAGKLNDGPVRRTPGVLRVFEHFRIEL